MQHEMSFTFLTKDLVPRDLSPDSVRPRLSTSFPSKGYYGLKVPLTLMPRHLVWFGPDFDGIRIKIQ